MVSNNMQHLLWILTEVNSDCFDIAPLSVHWKLLLFLRNIFWCSPTRAHHSGQRFPCEHMPLVPVKTSSPPPKQRCSLTASRSGRRPSQGGTGASPRPTPITPTQGHVQNPHRDGRQSKSRVITNMQMRLNNMHPTYEPSAAARKVWDKMRFKSKIYTRTKPSLGWELER